jgi:amidase
MSLAEIAELVASPFPYLSVFMTQDEHWLCAPLNIGRKDAKPEKQNEREANMMWRYARLSLVAALMSLLVLGCGQANRSSRPSPAADPTFATVAELQELFAAGTLTSEQLVRQCLDRITAYDGRGPALNAMITVNDRALETARALDAERVGKGPRGPLHGIPVILKDNYDTADMPTTGGSAILASSLPVDDAFVVRRLREAGVIILGKAHMSEFALSYGWLGYGSMVGQTRNPHNPLRDPSGSSSGSAVAVAAAYATLATGTDTAGSVRAPSTFCGVVGIKPTMGLVSRDGIIPASLSLDVAGPIARSVTDAALMLQVIAAADPADPATRASEGRLFDFQAALVAGALKEARLGVVRTFNGANADADVIFTAALEALEDRGATLVEVELPAPLDNLWSIMGPVVDGDFGPQIADYLADLPKGAPRTVADLIARAEAPRIAGSATPLNPARIQGFRDAEASGGYESAARKRSLEELMPAARLRLLALLDDERLDALVFLTVPCPASVCHDTKDPSYVCDIDDCYRPCYLANTTGHPEITVPAGFTATDNMPVGLSFLGRPFSEERLIGLAFDFEQAAQVYRIPVHTPSLHSKGL